MNRGEDETIDNNRIKRLRAGKDENNDGHQLNEDFGKYTAGPLDPTFGQHSAFPDNHVSSDEESHNVFAYLRQVRNEAENDRSVYFAEERSQMVQSETTPVIEKSEDHNDQIPIIAPEIVNSVVLRFLNLKLQINDSMAEIRDADMQMELPETANQWRTLVHSQVPFPIEYFYNVLDHPTIIKLVVYFTKWLCSSSNEYISQWIWIVLLRLDAPLDVNESAIIRELGKKAFKLYQKLDKSVSDVSRFTISMVLIITSEYYGQKDLLCNIRNNK